MTREFKKCGNINIPLNWEYRPIKTIIRGISDGTHGTFERVRDGYPLLSAKNVFDDGIHIGDNESQISEEAFNEITANGYPHKDDILLCCVGTIGRSTIYPYEKPMAFQRSVIFLTLNQNLMLPEMMHYLLMSDDVKAQENNLINQSAQAGLYQGSVKQIRVVVPPLTEQKEIIRFLNSSCHRIDNAISLHQQIIEKLEEYRKSVITQAVTKGLNPNVEMAMTGNNRLPIIPKEWKLIRLPHIVDTRHPYALGDGDHGVIKTDMYKNHGIPYIRVQNLGWGTPLSIDNVVYISENDNMKIVNSTLQPNDVLFAKTGATIGKTAIVPETIPMSNTTSHVGKITVSPRYNPKYIFYVLSSEYGYHQMWIYASQKATRPELSLDDIKNFVLPIPKERQEQNNIVQYLDNVCEKILESIAQHKVIIEKLQEYKQSLIYNAVTGKIDCRTEGGEVQ